MTASEIEKILNTLTVDSLGRIRGKNKAIDAVQRLYYQYTRKKEKHCPYCDSTKVIMFTADDDLCESCGKYFPAVSAK